MNLTCTLLSLVALVIVTGDASSLRQRQYQDETADTAFTLDLYHEDGVVELKGQRHLSQASVDIVDLDKRVKETLEKLNLYFKGDTLRVNWNNVVITAGEVKLRKTKKSNGIPIEVKTYTTKKNKNANAGIKFNINDVQDFERTLTSMVSKGLKWSKNNDIEATTEITPNSDTKTTPVIFPLNKKAPQIAKADLPVTYSFKNIGVSARSEAIPTAYFQVKRATAPFYTRLKINATGDLKMRLKSKGTNKWVTLSFSLREALGPNRGGGFKEGDGDNQVLFDAKGRFDWTYTEEVLLDVEQYSLDNQRNTVYKAETLSASL